MLPEPVNPLRHSPATLRAALATALAAPIGLLIGSTPRTVAFGEARAKAQLLAEKREEEAADAERLCQEAEARVDSWLQDAQERRLTTRELLKRLARDPG